MSYKGTSPKLYRRLEIEILVDSFLVTVCHFFYAQEHRWLSSTRWENNPFQEIIYR